MFGNAQINESAIIVKTNLPKYYSEIKAYAVEKWDTDNEMIVYEINEQCEALIELMDYIGKYDTIITKLMTKWGTYKDNKLIYVDYEMVLYDLKNWIKNADY